MPPLSVLVVDDEPLARERLRALLDDAPEVKIVGECASGRTAVKAIQEKRPDLVFLDVQMPGLDGFGVVEQIGAARMPAIVFVTAFDQYALKAFEIHALDYLLKPFDRERFEATLARERLRALLDDAPEVRIVGECASGRTAVKAIQEKRPDLVFLDVQMPGLDGFGVVEQIGAARMPA
ncbi:MAG TPA: response regulator, partial [Gemmatimonadales bacterium]|nr:response regulator [Gemmatimonadales bacterium]